MYFTCWQDKRTAFPRAGRHADLPIPAEEPACRAGALTVRARSLHMARWVSSCRLMSVSHLRQLWMYSWLPMQCLLGNKSSHSHNQSSACPKITPNIPDNPLPWSKEMVNQPPCHPWWFLLLHKFFYTLLQIPVLVQNLLTTVVNTEIF